MATTAGKTPGRASNVYLFKNGYGMIVKKFEFPSNKGNNGQPLELLDPPSNPIHGTFWIQSTPNISVSSIRTKKTHKLVERECLTVEDLIEANVGESIQLLVKSENPGTNEWISGKILSVKRIEQDSEDEDGTDKDDGTHANSRMPAISSMAPSFPCSRNLILFQTTDNGILALSLSSVQSIRAPVLKTNYQRKVWTNCLSIDYRDETGSNGSGLMKYLTFGITWAPSYNLILLSSSDPSVRKLRLSSKAVILNDIENIHVDNLSCIVGFPNISKFASVVDPIIGGQKVREFLDQLNQSEMSGAAGRMSRYESNVMSNSIMTQQAMMPFSAFNGNGPSDVQQDTNNDDLHLYDFKNVLLLKKERLMLPIFDLEIPYKDVYHCAIDTSQSGTTYSGYNEQKQSEEVWHSVEFENISNFVWTTAPIVITKGEQEQQFIGQDTLKYTIKGSTTLINLTKALDVRVQLEEKITNTNTARFTLLNVHYTKEQINGKISVMNYKSEQVVVVIKATLIGQTSNYNVKPKQDATKSSQTVANPLHELKWEVEVKPQQTIEITYSRLFNRRI